MVKAYEFLSKATANATAKKLPQCAECGTNEVMTHCHQGTGCHYLMVKENKAKPYSTIRLVTGSHKLVNTAKSGSRINPCRTQGGHKLVCYRQYATAQICYRTGMLPP